MNILSSSHWSVYLILHRHWPKLIPAPHSALGLIPGLFGIYTKVFYRECPQQVLPDSRCLLSYSATLSCLVSFFFLFQPRLSTYRQCPPRGAVSSLFYPFVCTDHLDTPLFLLPTVRFTPLCTVPATFRGASSGIFSSENSATFTRLLDKHSTLVAIIFTVNFQLPTFSSTLRLLRPTTLYTSATRKWLWYGTRISGAVSRAPSAWTRKQRDLLKVQKRWYIHTSGFNVNNTRNERPAPVAS